MISEGLRTFFSKEEGNNKQHPSYKLKELIRNFLIGRLRRLFSKDKDNNENVGSNIKAVMRNFLIGRLWRLLWKDHHNKQNHYYIHLLCQI